MTMTKICINCGATVSLEERQKVNAFLADHEDHAERMTEDLGLSHMQGSEAEFDADGAAILCAKCIELCPCGKLECPSFDLHSEAKADQEEADQEEKEEIKIETEGEMENHLSSALEAHLSNFQDDGMIAEFDLRTYEEAGIITRDRGVVLRISGKEYQITIKKSR